MQVDAQQTFAFITSPSLEHPNTDPNMENGYQALGGSNHEVFKITQDEWCDKSRGMIENRKYAVNLLRDVEMTNVLLVPSIRRGYVCFYHSCFDQSFRSIDDAGDNMLLHKPFSNSKTYRTVIGLVGREYHSGFRSINYEALLSPLQKPRNVHPNATFIPSLDDIVSQYILGKNFVRDEDDKRFNFNKVRSDPNNDVDVNAPTRRSTRREYKLYSNSQFLDPNLASFPSIGLGYEEIQANCLAHLIIQYCLRKEKTVDWDIPNDRTKLKEKLEPYYRMLIYLWLLGNGFGKGYQCGVISEHYLSERNEQMLMEAKVRMYKRSLKQGNAVRYDPIYSDYESDSYSDSETSD